VQVLLAGPTLDKSDDTMNGTVLGVEAQSADAVRALVQDDPTRSRRRP
jgi:hypothetical protein